MNNKTALVFALVLCFPIIGHADELDTQSRTEHARMADIKNETRFHNLVDESAMVYRAITEGSHGKIPASVLENARCIAVLPNVITGALLIGGTHGEGLASCKGSNGVWNQPAAISLNQGSIGLQAGAKSTDLVLFLQSDKAVQALKRGNFELGTEVSAVAGNFDGSIDTSRAGVVVYTRTEGVFAGASVNGGKIGNNPKDLTSYYGKKVDYTALLEGRETPDTSGYTQKLTKLFP